MTTITCGVPVWKLQHTDLSTNDKNEVISNSSIFLEFLDCRIKMAQTESPEIHILGSKKVLMDSAYLLENLAREMKKKAERMK
jgi:hypothetical protein